MNKLTFIFGATVLAAFSSAQTNFNFQNTNKDLDDLDHYYAYSLGFDFKVPQGQKIVGAQLKIKNIWNWEKEPNVLYLTLLNNPTTGVKRFYDDQGGGDYFAGKGTRFDAWSDPVGGRARNVNLTYDFKALGLLEKLSQSIDANGKFGIGFDPDCHYFNDGISFHIQTAAVPEPATLSALAVGGLVALRRRRMKKNKN